MPFLLSCSRACLISPMSSWYASLQSLRVNKCHPMLIRAFDPNMTIAYRGRVRTRKTQEWYGSDCSSLRVQSQKSRAVRAPSQATKMNTEFYMI